jgi:hypothetical protein
MSLYDMSLSTGYDKQYYFGYFIDRHDCEFVTNGRKYGQVSKA